MSSITNDTGQNFFEDVTLVGIILVPAKDIKMKVHK
jgi:hypothetical protein